MPDSFLLYGIHCTECYITCMVIIWVFIFCNFHILFCVWMLGTNSGWSDMALYMNTSCLTAVIVTCFSGGYQFDDMTWCQIDIYFQCFAHLWIFGGILCMWAYIIWYWSYLYVCFTGILYMSITQLWHIVCNHDHCNSSL